MIKIRAKFGRYEKVKFISHLDIMRMFERALRRARLPIEYSSGFNPHPKIVFGLPLSVGMTTESDYVDFQLCEEIKPIDFVKRLNSQLPEDVEVIDAKLFDSKKNIMALINGASYDVETSFCKDMDQERLAEIIRLFLEKDEIIVSKKSKSKVKDVNIRPLVHKIELKKVYFNFDNCDQNLGNDNLVTFSILVNAGIENNLKPELFLEALKGLLGSDIKPVNIHRTGLYVRGNSDFIDPLADAVL